MAESGGLLLKQSSPTNQPTNPTNPINVPRTYVHLRVTTAHENWEELRANILRDVPEYISYPHTGVKTDKQHFHVFIPTDQRKSVEKFRKRARQYLGLTGHSNYVECDYRENGLHAGCQYGSHEPGSKPFVSSDRMQAIVATAPPWIPDLRQRLLRLESHEPGKPPKLDREWQLTYSTLVSACVRHVRQNAPALDGQPLIPVLKHLIGHTRWRPSPQMRRQGIHISYDQDFQLALGLIAPADISMSWVSAFGTGRDSI